jgi:hypothetical protein
MITALGMTRGHTDRRVDCPICRDLQIARVIFLRLAT